MTLDEFALECDARQLAHGGILVRHLSTGCAQLVRSEWWRDGEDLLRDALSQLQALVKIALWTRSRCAGLISDLSVTTQ